MSGGGDTGIRFGTSGWRGIIAREFTFERVELVLDAIAAHLRGTAAERSDSSVCIGGDTRFLSPELARMAAARMAAHGFTALLSDRPAPTPMLSHAVRRLGGAAVINFTASHNPALYNGIKFSPHHGGPADSEVTGDIESRIGNSPPPSGDGAPPVVTDFLSSYTDTMRELIDLEALRANPLRIVYDPFYGTGRGILDEFLRRNGSAVRTIHDKRDPLFGETRPEPCEEGLRQLSADVVRSGASLGISTDGDADRFGIVDETGAFVSPHDFLPLLLDYLVESRGMTGIVVRSLSTGSLLDSVATAHGIEVVETPVGFKHLGALMIERDVLLAGEESGGLSIGGHVPEKDGILACLLAAEMVAVRGQGIAEQLRQRIWPRYGHPLNVRLDMELTPGLRAAVVERLIESTPGAIAGLRVTRVDRRDGAKMYLDTGREGAEAWVLVRLSGTEPLARLFFQAPDGDLLAALQRDTERITGD